MFEASAASLYWLTWLVEQVGIEPTPIHLMRVAYIPIILLLQIKINYTTFRLQLPGVGRSWLWSGSTVQESNLVYPSGGIEPSLRVANTGHPSLQWNIISTISKHIYDPRLCLVLSDLSYTICFDMVGQEGFEPSVILSCKDSGFGHSHHCPSA